MTESQSNSIIIFYAHGDDVDPATSFVARLHRDLTTRGFEVWFDRMAMSSRGLMLHQEIQDAVAAHERLVLVVGPKVAVSDYVRRRGRETRAERCSRSRPTRRSLRFCGTAIIPWSPMS